MSKLNVVGIDLGTTYSAIARLDRYGQPVALANAEGEFSTPSVVYFSEKGPIVGTPALRSTVTDAERTVQNAKRDLGDPQAGWTIDARRYDPVDVSALILRKLKEDAEEQIGPITHAVITVPAHFDAYRRQLTIQAAEKAGLVTLDLVNEPVAAALCFILGEEGTAFQELAEEQRILVYDLGGGTFDLSMVHYDAENVRVLATNGDLKLGGIDWNRRLIDAIADEYRQEHGADPREQRRSLQELALAVEECKRTLSNPKWNEVAVTVPGPEGTIDRTVSRQQFESLTADLVERTRAITQKLLEHTETGWARINTILSVGGSTRMPMIRKMLRSISGITPNYSLSPDLSVAQGAALYAGILLSKTESAVPETVRQRLQPIQTTNVNSNSLGLLVREQNANRVNHIVIPRNTPLPATAVRTVGTTKPDQRRIRLQIVEGEGKTEDDVETICTCVIDELPPDLPEDSVFEVSLSYDATGLLEVRARHLDSGLLAGVSLMREKGLAGVADKPPEPAAGEPEPASVSSPTQTEVREEQPTDDQEPPEEFHLEDLIDDESAESDRLAALTSQLEEDMESLDPRVRIEAINQTYRRWRVELFPVVDELARFDLSAEVRDAAKKMIEAVRAGKRPDG